MSHDLDPAVWAYWSKLGVIDRCIGIGIKRWARARLIAKSMNELTNFYFICNLILTWDNVMIQTIFLSLMLITKCAMSEYTVSKLRFLLCENVCSCAKCVNAIRSYTLWSCKPFLWFDSMCWTLGEAFSAVVSPKGLHCNERSQDKESCLYGVTQQTVKCSLVAVSDLQ